MLQLLTAEGLLAGSCEMWKLLLQELLMWARVQGAGFWQAFVLLQQL
jgi:hypothetical protein